MTIQHRRATAPASVAAHRRLLTIVIFLVAVIISDLHVAASSSTANDTDAECSAGNTNDKNAQVCASRIVPPSNGVAAATGDSSESNTVVNDGACEDMHADCAERAERGECGGKSAGFMLDECRLSCHVCGDYEYVPLARDRRPTKHSVSF